MPLLLDRGESAALERSRAFALEDIVGVSRECNPRLLPLRLHDKSLLRLLDELQSEFLGSVLLGVVTRLNSDLSARIRLRASMVAAAEFVSLNAAYAWLSSSVGSSSLGIFLTLFEGVGFEHSLCASLCCLDVHRAVPSGLNSLLCRDVLCPVSSVLLLLQCNPFSPVASLSDEIVDENVDRGDFADCSIKLNTVLLCLVPRSGALLNLDLQPR